jgi:signal transduction histidine kinase
MLARAAIKQRAHGAADLDQTLERIATLAQGALVEMRLLLFELRPPQLGEEGLCAAIQTFVEAFRARTEQPIRCVVETDVRLSREVETAIFRIVQEALANAARHAHASEVTVRLATEAGRFTALVADDGVGFDASLLEAGMEGGAGAGAGGLGLRSMRERAAAAGIDLQVVGGPGAGTRVLLSVPLPATAVSPR